MPSTPLQVALHAGSLPVVQAILSIPELTNDDDANVRITQRPALHGPIVSGSLEKLEALLTSGLPLKHLATLMPVGATMALEGATPVVFLVLKPIIHQNWDKFDGAMCTKNTSMLRKLLAHSTKQPDFKTTGPVIDHGEGKVGIIALAAYMCHALPMHTMLAVRCLAAALLELRTRVYHWWHHWVAAAHD